MNLNLLYDPIYWATACLSINGGGDNEEDDGSTDYAKVAAAIGQIQTQGIHVSLPDINLSNVGFTPNIENKSILYGLRGIKEVGDDFVNRIILHRPYTSMQDFLDRVAPTMTQAIALIKAGAFDNLHKDENRRDLMYYYIQTLCPPKRAVNLTSMRSLVAYGLIPEHLNSYIFLYNFNRYIKLSKKDDYLFLDDRAFSYYEQHFDVGYLEQGKKGCSISAKIWSKLYDTGMDGLRTWLQDNQEMLIAQIRDYDIDKKWQEKCSGSISSWEMESVGFYYHEHELSKVFHNEFKFSDFAALPEIPKIIEYKEYKGRTFPVYELHSIVGTVLGRNKYKYTVTLLTPTGIATVKFGAEQFSKYHKQISVVDKQTNKKTIVEKSWFTQGEKIIVCGWRVGDQFMARGRPKENKKAIYKILDVGDSGVLNITRYRSND